MSKLTGLQTSFINDCLSGALTADNTSMAKHIDTRSISAKALMAIYQNSAIANITNSLQLSYPAVEKLVGKDFFEQASRQYIFNHWPTTANMDDYGEYFPQFLAELVQAKSLTYLKDVAQLEWLYHQSSLANDSADFDWTILAKVPPEEALNLHFLLAPTVELIKSSWPIDEIWQMNQDNGHRANIHQSSEHQSNDHQDIELCLDRDKDTYIVLFRRGLKTEMMTISMSEFELLHSLAKGQSFEQAINSAIALDADISIDLWLTKYIELGVICGFSL